MLCFFVVQNNKPFGNVHTILCGDLLQLKPVPNLEHGDAGDNLISAENYQKLIPHNVLLTSLKTKEKVRIYNSTSGISVMFFFVM